MRQMHQLEPAGSGYGTAVTPSIATLTINPAVDEGTKIGRLVPHRKLRCAPSIYEAGGGGINVSRAIRRLDGDSLAIFTSGGDTGALLEKLLEGEGVRYRAIPIAGWTRENLNVLEETSGNQFRFVKTGPELSEAEWRRVLGEVESLSSGYLVASGSLPVGVPSDFYGRVADAAKKRGLRLVLDAPADSVLPAGRRGIFLAKPSLHEFQQLTGSAAADEQSLFHDARVLVSSGFCEVLVLSLGHRGAIWFTPTQEGRLAAPRVPVASSVGAGDSLVAGIVLQLSRGSSLPEAVRFGLAAGSASVMNPGTELCRREDVDRLHKEILREERPGKTLPKPPEPGPAVPAVGSPK